MHCLKLMIANINEVIVQATQFVAACYGGKLGVNSCLKSGVNFG